MCDFVDDEIIPLFGCNTLSVRSLCVLKSDTVVEVENGEDKG